MAGEGIQVGNRVRVVSPGSKHYGRTAKVEAPGSPVGGAGGESASREWRIVFEWPLGGIEGRTTLQESELEVIARL